MEPVIPLTDLVPLSSIPPEIMMQTSNDWDVRQAGLELQQKKIRKNIEDAQLDAADELGNNRIVF